MDDGFILDAIASRAVYSRSESLAMHIMSNWEGKSLCQPSKVLVCLKGSGAETCCQNSQACMRPTASTAGPQMYNADCPLPD